MAIPTALAALVGYWHGTNKVWLSPNDPVMESKTEVVIALTALGKFLTIQYTWSVDNEPQEGLLLIGQEAQDKVVRAAWVDSWHNGDVMMVCSGEAGPDGGVWVKGAYAAPPGPDWGWKITLEPRSGDAFRMVMDNIMPDGQEMLAVEVAISANARPGNRNPQEQ